MSIKRYTANKDNTITNAFKENLTTRATDANMGASDIIEVFSIYGQAATSSTEQARALVEFPVSQITADRAASTIPASGSVSFILKLTNAEHSSTTPSDFTLSVCPLTNAWSEGTGLDMEGYTDTGVSSWSYRVSGSSWGGADGSFNAALRKDAAFSSGTENLEVDISSIVEKWLDGTINNYGLLIKLSGSAENVVGGADPLAKKSYYTKKFFSRSSEFVLKRPIIEARFDNSTQDDRGDVIKSSSLAPASDNLNNIYLYNKIRGNFRDIPNTGSNLLVQLVPSVGEAPVTITGPDTVLTYVTASKVSTGLYKASFAYSGTLASARDVWQYTGSSTNGYVQLYTGSAFSIYQDGASSYYPLSSYVINITNLKPSYEKDDKAQFRIHSRSKDWKPNIYTVASNNSPVSNIREGYYKISRPADNMTIVPYSTGSSPSYSKLSYDVSGSYFDLDMSILEPNYLYEISILRKEKDGYIEQKEKFKFRINP